MHVVTPSDTRRIASVVVLRNGGYRRAAQRRAAVAQLSKVLQSVSIAPAVPITGCTTPENMMGTMPAVLRCAYEDNERRAALFVGMANGSISVPEAFDLALEDEIRLTRNEFAELAELWRTDACGPEASSWAYTCALTALTEYAAEYVAAEALTIRADCLRVFRETRAYAPDSDMVFALLILLADAIIQTDTAETYHVQRPPDIPPLVSLLTIAAVLAPRAPQFRPSVA